MCEDCRGGGQLARGGTGLGTQDANYRTMFVNATHLPLLPWACRTRDGRYGKTIFRKRGSVLSVLSTQYSLHLFSLPPQRGGEGASRSEGKASLSRKREGASKCGRLPVLLETVF